MQGITNGISEGKNNMPEEPFSNREITEKFQNLDTLIREKHDDEMTKIGGVELKISGLDTKVSYTNGRVRWLEKMIWLAIGFCSCVTILILPFIWTLINKGKL